MGTPGSFPLERDQTMTTTGDKGTSAGGRHGSKEGSSDSPSGLNERTGEFNVGEKIIFGMRNGNIMLRRSPQGEEVEVAGATLAGLMIDAFFTGKFGGKDGDYPPVVGKNG